MVSSWLRISVIASVGIFGAITGGLMGVFYALIAFGLICFVMQMALGIVGGVVSAVKTPRVRVENKTLNVEVHEGSSIPGRRVNVDPTRPTVDDFMGMANEEFHRGLPRGK